MRSAPSHTTDALERLMSRLTIGNIDDISRIKAFVIGIEPPADPDALADELRDWCKEHLRRYEYPHVVDFVTDFPRTPTGKIQRYKLRDAEAAAVASVAAAD